MILVSLAFIMTLMMSVGFSVLYVEDSLLTDQEKEYLGQEIEKASEYLEIDFAIAVIENNLGMTVEAYTEYFYDKSELGPNAAVLVLDLSTRKYDLYLVGTAHETYNEKRDKIFTDRLIDHWKSDQFYDGLLVYVKNFKQLRMSKLMVLGISIAGAALLSALIVFLFTRPYRTVRHDPLAHNYIREGSFELTSQSDTYLYSTVKRTAKPKSNSSGGSGSSGGSSHGGGSF